jgi:hypothetical protein
MTPPAPTPQPPPLVLLLTHARSGEGREPLLSNRGNQ